MTVGLALVSRLPGSDRSLLQTWHGPMSVEWVREPLVGLPVFWPVIPSEICLVGLFLLHSVLTSHSQPMTEENASTQNCGGKKKAMLAYGLVQISATVISAVSLAVIALGFCSVKQESKVFNGCVEEVIAEGKTNAQAVRYCNGGN